MSESFKVKVIWSEEDESFVATMKEFNGITGFGKSEAEAAEDLKIGLALMMEVILMNVSKQFSSEPELLELDEDTTEVIIKKDIHTGHCCICQCKYKDPNCTVVTGILIQEFACETYHDNDHDDEAPWERYI